MSDVCWCHYTVFWLFTVFFSPWMGGGLYDYSFKFSKCDCTSVKNQGYVFFGFYFTVFQFFFSSGHKRLILSLFFFQLFPLSVFSMYPSSLQLQYSVVLLFSPICLISLSLFFSGGRIAFSCSSKAALVFAECSNRYWLLYHRPINGSFTCEMEACKWTWSSVNHHSAVDWLHLAAIVFVSQFLSVSVARSAGWQWPEDCWVCVSSLEAVSPSRWPLLVTMKSSPQGQIE